MAYEIADNWGYDEVEENANPYASPVSTQYNLVTEPKDKKSGLGEGAKAYDAPTQPARSTMSEGKSRREEEIEERERKAKLLEVELNAREEKLRKSMNNQNFRPKKNWPHPSIGWARNAISLDIPKAHQNDVRKFYALWLLTAIAAILNILLCFWYGFSSEGESDVGFLQWVLAICYVVVGLPGSWMCWYKRFYRAVQWNQQIPMLFFVFLMLHMLWAAVMALGLTLTGSFSFLVMAKCFTQGYDSVAVAMMINGALWSFVAVFSGFSMKIAQNAIGKFLLEKHLSDLQKQQQQQPNVRGTLN